MMKVVIPVWPDLEAQFIPPIFQAALSRLQRCLPEMGSKWVRFIGSLLNIKNKVASICDFFLTGER